MGDAQGTHPQVMPIAPVELPNDLSIFVASAQITAIVALVQCLKVNGVLGPMQLETAIDHLISAAPPDRYDVLLLRKMISDLAYLDPFNVAPTVQ